MFGFAHFDPPRRISPPAQMVLFILEGYVANPFFKAPFTEKGAFFCLRPSQKSPNPTMKKTSGFQIAG
jgi:hypothetical protein